MKKIPTSLYPKFFAQCRKAALSLGHTSKDAQEAYYKRVLNETAHCSSIKSLPSMEAYEACLTRFATDAQEFASAVDPEVEKQKRRAYVVKVMAAQIMQLKGLDDKGARAYFDGVLNQARHSAGVMSDGESFWMDITAGSLLLVLQILDSHLRKLKREYFPTFPISFDDKIKFVRFDGSTILRETVDKSYYKNLPFKVRF